MPDATMDRPEHSKRPDTIVRRDILDQFGADRARALIREALDHAGAKPVGIDWAARREETLRLLDRIEAELDRDLAIYAPNR